MADIMENRKTIQGLKEDFRIFLQERRRSGHNRHLDTMSVSDKEDVITAVNYVYRDPFTPRVITGNGQMDKDRVAKLLTEVGEKLYSYFNSTDRQPFDEFHDGLCKYFVGQYNTIGKGLISVGGHEGIFYGHAQKLVNMTVKYMYCFGDADAYDAVFADAHMPIDGYILEALDGEYRINGISGRSYKNTPWTKLTEDLYKELTAAIRKNLPDGTTALENEFSLWNLHRQ